jgi:hypothetical protein
MPGLARIKGEVERDIQQIGFCSLTICRPSIIAGERSETRIAEGAVLAISRALAPILPKQFHVNPASVIAASLLDSVLTARAGCRWIFAEESQKQTTSPSRDIAVRVRWAITDEAKSVTVEYRNVIARTQEISPSNRCM